MEQKEGSRQSSMSVRLKLRLASQQALADLPLPKQMLQARQTGCDSNSDRENWALSWETADFFQSVRTEGCAVLLKAISNLSKGAVPRKRWLSSFLIQRYPAREIERMGRKPLWLPTPGKWRGTGTLHSPALVVQPGCVTSKAFRSSSFSCSAGCAAK